MSIGGVVSLVAWETDEVCLCRLLTGPKRHGHLVLHVLRPFEHCIQQYRGILPDVRRNPQGQVVAWEPHSASLCAKLGAEDVSLHFGLYENPDGHFLVHWDSTG